MWSESGAAMPSVLIVENGTGEVFIIENKSSESLMDRILKSPRARKPVVKFKTREASPVDLKQDIKEEDALVIEEYLDEYYAEDDTKDEASLEVPFVDPSDDLQYKSEQNIKVEDAQPSVTIAEPRTFDGRWSSASESEDVDDSAEKNVSEKKSAPKPTRRKKLPSDSETKKSGWCHKMRSLAGKIACKYCDTVFATKSEQSLHQCQYLQCDAKNFICRICNKELSRKTFSNHLHETLDCQYCGKNFVNPRNMKAHIEKQHKKEDFIPPQKKNYDDYLKYKESHETAQREVAKRERPKYQKKKERFECDLCGKYLVSLRSMSFHMSLHTGDTCYICENCGEKFFTPNGIKGHSCEKKRRRPDKDFRTYDLRHCRFCDTRFGSFDENKAHSCVYELPGDPKSVYCRCCGKILAKLAFNRHMEIHSGIDWICTICDRKLATERALKVHMTTHSGNKPYKCKIPSCTESFINKVVLERHMRFHGLATKVFRCEYCFKQLSTETSLKSHVQRLHKTTVQCELCKTEFTSREQLKDHLATAHEPSVCQVCRKSFTLPRYLKMHEKLHFEDSTARVQCLVCSKLLGMKNIKSHVFRHHPDQFESWQQINPTL